MKIRLTKEPNKCTSCSGFGTHHHAYRETTKLIECPKCHSIHPEAFGMRYEKDNSNFRMIVIKSWFDWFF